MNAETIKCTNQVSIENTLDTLFDTREKVLSVFPRNPGQPSSIPLGHQCHHRLCLGES